MTEREELKQLRSFLEGRQSNVFHVMEEGVDEDTQREYIDYAPEDDKLTDVDEQPLGDTLFDPTAPLNDKKKALVTLAHVASTTAYRFIEKFYEQADPSLKTWSALALQECRMFLEGKLTGRSMGFISGGMGGVQDKLRYYLVIIPVEGKQFTPTQKKIVKDEFHYMSKKFRCAIETVDISSDNFVGLTVLIPIDTPVGSYVEASIAQCNELGNFVFDGAYVTNRCIPEEEELYQYIDKVRHMQEDE
ncbi:MAG: hypothetical protein LBS63_04390 [Prevotellaceae bacterium]|jgi:hypothetical protein|nr:hypothetical protein [Prevotellaceae bacterium]